MGLYKWLPEASAIAPEGTVSLLSKAVDSINDLVMTVRAHTEMGALEISPPSPDALEKTWWWGHQTSKP